MTPLHPRLSDRQEAVLLLLADGHGLGEIAERLGTTTRAVRRLRDRARCELDAATTTQAVAIVVRLRADSPDSGRPDTTRSDSDRLPAVRTAGGQLTPARRVRDRRRWRA